MAIAGVLEVQMLANMARLQSDMTKGVGIVTGATAKIESVVSSAKVALAGLGIGVGVGYFASLIKGSIDAADRMNDLSKTTSIAVEQLAGLQLAAKQSGGDLESIAASINKLSQNMGKDGEKFKALGVTAKDPLEAFKQLSDIFVAIRDPQMRAAVAAEALGKSWAGAAPLLAEGGAKIQETTDKGTRLSGITQEMAERADEFNDSLAELNTVMGKTSKGMVSDMLPAFTAITKAIALAYEESGKLQSVWVAIGGIGAFLWTDEFRGTRGKIADLSKDLAGLIKQKEDMEKNPTGLLSRFGTGGLDEKIAKTRGEIDALVKSLEPLAKPKVDPAAAAAAAAKGAAFLKTGGAGAVPKREIESFLRSLEEEALKKDSILKITEVLALLDTKRYADATKGEKGEIERAKRAALTIDLKRLEKAANDDLVKASMVGMEDLTKISDNFEKAERDRLATMTEKYQALAEKYQALADPVAAFLKQLDEINELERRGRFLRAGDADIARAKIVADIAALDKTKEVTDEMVEFWKQAARSMQSSMSDFFFDVMQGKLTDLGSSFKRTVDRMVADMMAAKAATALFGADFGKGGAMGGLIGSLFNGGKSFGGSADTGATLVGMFAGGTDYVPRTGLALVHQGERITPAGGGGGAPNIAVNVVNQGQPVAATQSGPAQWDGEKWVLGIVLNAMDSNQRFRSAMGAR